MYHAAAVLLSRFIGGIRSPPVESPHKLLCFRFSIHIHSSGETARCSRYLGLDYRKRVLTLPQR